MTPEQLDKLVRKGKPKQVYEAVVDLDDATRKKLLPAMKKLNRAIRTGDGLVSGRLDWEKEDKVRRKWDKINRHIFTNADLATLAIGPAADAHRINIRWGGIQDFSRHVSEILVKHNPDWLDTWVNKRLSGEWPEIDFQMIRHFYEAGVIEKPSADGYVQLLVNELNSYEYDKPETYRPASERLLEKADYLEEDIWRLFECENTAFTYDYTDNSDRGPKNYENWNVVVEKLVDQGHMDRDRTLDATLTALDNEFKQNYLSGYAKLHAQLNPTPDEMKAREPRYVELLANPTGPIVSFAVRMLAKLMRAKRLDADLFLSSAAPVFGQKTKGTGVQALKIAAGLKSNDEKLLPAVMSFAISAMAHPSPDVQAQALELIGDGIDAADPDTRSRFERQAAHLSTKLQSRAVELLGNTVDEPEAPVVDTSHLAADVASLSDDVRALVGLAGDAASGRMPPPLDYSPLALPKLPGAFPFARIDSVEELLEHAAHIVEIVDSVDQVEQLLDGIARLGCERDGDFEKLAAPLRQRIESGAGGSSYGLGSYWAGMPLVMVDLILTWLSGKPYKTPQHSWWYGSTPSPTWLFSMSRLREIQNMLAEGRPAQLLSTPSYTGGWVDAMHLVERVADHLDKGHKVYAADLMLALLRLSPAGRPEALAAASELGEVEGRIVRFALGGDDRPTKDDKRFASVWLCAGRARDPHGSLREPLKEIASHIPDLPTHLDPADYSWTAATKVNDHGYKVKSMTFESLAREHTGEKTGFMDRIAKSMKGKMRWEMWPIGAMHTTPDYSWGAIFEMSVPWRIDWFAMQWPMNPEPALQYGSLMLELRLDDDTSRDAPAHVFLNALFEPAVCWGEMAYLALCLGLTSKSADARGYAVDAVIPAIESGHADPSKVVDVFSRLLAGDMLRLNRLAMTLSQVLDVSPLHKWWVATVLCGVIARADKPPRNGHFLYELALDSLTPIGCAVPDDAALTLKKLKGSSKAAKLARELLSLEGSALEEPPEAVVADALAGRIEFARSLT